MQRIQKEQSLKPAPRTLEAPPDGEPRRESPGEGKIPEPSPEPSADPTSCGRASEFREDPREGPPGKPPGPEQEKVPEQMLHLMGFEGE